MKKRILSFMLALAMLVVMLPTAAFAADNEVWCGGVKMSPGKYLSQGSYFVTETMPADNYAYLSADGTIITLHNYSYNDIGVKRSGSHNEGIWCSIYSKYDLNIVLEGENTLNGSAIYSLYGDINIRGGSGTLTDSLSTDSYINSENDITISDCVFSADANGPVAGKVLANKTLNITNSRVTVATKAIPGIALRGLSVFIKNSEVYAAGSNFYGLYAETVSHSKGLNIESSKVVAQTIKGPMEDDGAVIGNLHITGYPGGYSMKAGEDEKSAYPVAQYTNQKWWKIEPFPISGDISVNDIDAPTIGSKPDFAGSVPDNCGYHISSISWIETNEPCSTLQQAYENYNWQYINKAPENITFKPGKYYVLVCTVAADWGQSFGTLLRPNLNSVFMPSIQSSTYTNSLTQQNMYMQAFCLTPEDNIINKINIGMSPTSLPCNLDLASQVSIAAAGTPAYGSNVILNKQSVTWSPAQSGYGTEHELTLKLTPPDGYAFSNTLEITGINGSCSQQVSNKLAIITVDDILCECPHNWEYTASLGSVSDTEYHWKECSLCGETTAKEFHTFGTPVYKSEGIETVTCTKCGVSVDRDHVTSLINTVRINDPVFRIGGPIPATLSGVAYESNLYEIRYISWARSDGVTVNAGDTFESGDFEYLLTVGVAPKYGYTIGTMAPDITGAKMNTPGWTMNELFSYNSREYTYEIVMKGKPRPAPITAGASSIDVTLPSNLAGKTFAQVIEEYTVKNQKPPNEQFAIFAYDADDKENAVCGAAKIGTGPWMYLPNNALEYVFAEGKTYYFEFITSFNGQYGWTDEQLNIINQKQAVSVNKSVLPNGFIIKAYIQAKKPQKKVIEIATVTVEPPRPGELPATTATVPSGANYHVESVNWLPNDAVFKGKTEYVALVELAPNDGFSFAEDNIIIINNKDGNSYETIYGTWCGIITFDRLLSDKFEIKSITKTSDTAVQVDFDAPSDATMFVAGYNNEGKLFEIRKVSIKAGETARAVNILPIPNAPWISTVKALIWDVDTLEPLCDSISYEY